MLFCHELYEQHVTKLLYLDKFIKEKSLNVEGELCSKANGMELSKSAPLGRVLP